MNEHNNNFIYENNFNGLRLLAAFQVMLGHAINQLGIQELYFLEHFIEIFPGVPIFFIISGFLIGLSYQRQPNLSIYFSKRFLRIYPGLAFSFLISVFVVYFFDISFSYPDFAIWAFTQLTILQNYDPSFLETFGVGKLNPPLWTIAVEIQFYIVAPLLILYFKQKKMFSLLLLLMIFFVFKEVNNYLHAEGGVSGKLFNQTFLPHFYLFFIGAYISFKVELIKKYFLNKFVMWLTIFSLFTIFLNYLGVEVRSNWQNLISSLLLGFLAISFAYSFTGFTKRFRLKDDISYGVYIYHYIFINIFYHYGYVNSALNLLLYIIVCCSVAFFSWRFIEQPMTKLKIKSSR